MSAYELMDLRATHVEMVANFFKIWITATFAAVATAFFFGPDLGLFLSIGVLAFYIVVAIANAVSMRTLLVVLAGIEKDLNASIETSDHESETVLAATSVKTSVQAPMTMAVPLLGSLCACAYLIYRMAS